MSEQLREEGRSSAARRRSGVVLGVIVVALALVAVAHGAGNALTVTGPRSNKLGTTFTYDIAGSAVGGADYLVGWEQLHPRSGCASTYAAESTRMFLPSMYDIALETARPVTPNSSFSTVAHFNAVNPGEHGLCVYLISVETGDTYAHVAAWWTNHG